MHAAHRLKEGAAFVDDHRVNVVPVTEARWELEIVGGFSGYRQNCEHSDCCGKQTKYPRHLSAGFGVSDHAHGKRSLIDRSPDSSSGKPHLDAMIVLRYPTFVRPRPYECMSGLRSRARDRSHARSECECGICWITASSKVRAEQEIGRA